MTEISVRCHAQIERALFPMPSPECSTAAHPPLGSTASLSPASWIPMERHRGRSWFTFGSWRCWQEMFRPSLQSSGLPGTYGLSSILTPGVGFSWPRQALKDSEKLSWHQSLGDRGWLSSAKCCATCEGRCWVFGWNKRSSLAPWHVGVHLSLRHLEWKEPREQQPWTFSGLALSPGCPTGPFPPHRPGILPL